MSENNNLKGLDPKMPKMDESEKPFAEAYVDALEKEKDNRQHETGFSTGETFFLACLLGGILVVQVAQLFRV